MADKNELEELRRENHRLLDNNVKMAEIAERISLAFQNIQYDLDRLTAIRRDNQ